MNKKTIILKESELIELISNAVNNITEEEKEKLRSKVNEQILLPPIILDVGQYDTNEYIQKSDNADKDDGEPSYFWNYVIDAISIIAYVLCPFTAGIGCAVSVIADLGNALIYIYRDEDYFMAAMQMAFSIVPGGEFLKYMTKPAAKFMNPMFKAVWEMGKAASSKNIRKEVARTVTKMSKKEISEARRIFTKSMVNKLKVGWATIDATAKSYYGKVPGLKTMWSLITGIMRALLIFVEMIWFDPEYSGNIFVSLGEWSGFEKLSSWGEAMQNWKKRGVKYANEFYNWSGIGGIKALVTTTVLDCNNTVYEWEHVKSEWLAENNQEENEFDIDALEEAWWKDGWRPKPSEQGGRSGPRDPEKHKENLEIASNYILFTNCAEFKKGEYKDKLTNCKTFTSFYKSLSDDERWDMMMSFLTLCTD